MGTCRSNDIIIVPSSSCFRSDEEMEEANPVEANDSDYDPNKDAKKEVNPGPNPDPLS